MISIHYARDRKNEGAFVMLTDGITDVMSQRKGLSHSVEGESENSSRISQHITGEYSQ